MPKNLSVNEYKDIGIRHYKQKQYQKAVDAFTEAINVSITESIDLLDLRSASNAKLENFPRALQDSQRMIKIDKKNVKGHLRTGQVLQKMGKPEVALDIYHYGARNVSVSDKDYMLLRQERDKLQQKLAPPRSLDPLTVLPVELAEIVLTYLGFKKRVNCLNVSRNWYKFIASREALWTQIDLSYAKKTVKGQFLRRCIDRSHNKIKEIIVHRVDDAHILRTIATKCPKLDTIEVISGPGGESILEAVMCGKNLKILSLSEHVSVSLDMVSQIVRRRPTLTDLECSISHAHVLVDWREDIPSLKKFVARVPLNASINIQLMILDLLFDRAPNIEHLSLSNFTGMMEGEFFFRLKRLHTLEIDRIALASSIQVTSSIKRIALTRLGKSSTTPFWQGVIVPFDPNLITPPAGGVPRLEDLEISNYNSLGEAWEGLEGLLSDSFGGVTLPMPHLRRFSIHDSGALDFDLSAIETRAKIMALLSLPSLASLEELYLGSCTLKDDQFLQLPKMFPDLKKLDLSRTTVTGVSVRTFVEHWKDLTWLGLDDCMSLGPDAVEWAREKGVTVHHSFGGKHKSGKRLIGAF